MRVKIFEFWPILHTGCMADIAFLLLIFVCKLADDDITSGWKTPCRGSMEKFQIIKDFNPNISALLAD